VFLFLLCAGAQAVQKPCFFLFVPPVCPSAPFHSDCFFLLFALRSCCLATHASDNDDNDNDNVSTFESPPFLPREAAIVIGFNLAAPVTGSLVPQVCPWPPFNLPWPSSHDLDASTPLLKSPLAGGLIA